MRAATRRVILFVVFFLLVLGGYLFFRLVLTPHVNVPADFSDARTAGAILAQDIVNDSNQIVANVNRINDLDKAHQNADALKLIADTQKIVQEVRSKGVDLDKKLQVMAAALPSINSDAAQQTALESITDRLALISRLITYTDNVQSLLNALQRHFETGVDNGAEITRLVNAVNEEVQAINTFNSQAGMAMDRFDQIVR